MFDPCPRTPFSGVLRRIGVLRFAAVLAALARTAGPAPASLVDT